MHECRECGMMCDCDGEDHDQPAPPDCQHECEPDEEDMDEGWGLDPNADNSLWESADAERRGTE